MRSTDRGASTVPAPCAQWCRQHEGGLGYQLMVLDDGSEVDLDWWNTRLVDHGVHVALRGRDLDGRIITAGRATIKRGDLYRGSALYHSTSKDLGLLYLCAAWLQAHRTRDVAKRFPVTSNPARDDKDRFKCVSDSLRTLRTHSLPLAEWPACPGVGVALMATFMWAANGPPSPRAQLIDKQGVAQLVHEGWLETAGVNDFSCHKYLQYTRLLHSWARQISVPTELVELWLIERWHARQP